MPIHELIIFPASDAFQSDPAETLKHSREFFGTVEGCYSIYAGVAEEEGTGYVVIEWASYEHHQAIKSLPGFPHILGLAPIFRPGDPNPDPNPTKVRVYHVDFGVQVGNSPDVDVDAALGMDTTEVLALTLRDGKTKDELNVKLSEVLRLRVAGLELEPEPKLTAVEAQEGCSDADSNSLVWGETREEPGKFFLFLGRARATSKTRFGVVGAEAEGAQSVLDSRGGPSHHNHVDDLLLQGTVDDVKRSRVGFKKVL